MTDAFVKAINNLDEKTFQDLYGRWDPLEPAQVAQLFAASSIRWWIVGGRAARIGAAPRHHEDTDVAVRAGDLGKLRDILSDWHLWETHGGTLRPLLPEGSLTDGREQLWARRTAHQPWQLDIQLDRGDGEWVFKKDSRVRLPWHRALHTVDRVPYLRPEVALLHKAHLNRPKDRADLAAAQLDSSAREWLADVSQELGHHEWARLTREGK